MNLESAMTLALDLARKSAQASQDVPVGAVVLNENGEVVATGVNERELNNDPTSHAEIVALRQAAQVTGSWRLDGLTLVVTLEPCAMCAGAIIHVRIRRVIFGCPDERGGAAGGTINLLQLPGLNHRCEIMPGVLREQCAELLQSFFQARRGRAP